MKKAQALTQVQKLWGDNGFAICRRDKALIDLGMKYCVGKYVDSPIGRYRSIEGCSNKGWQEAIGNVK